MKIKKRISRNVLWAGLGGGTLLVAALLLLRARRAQGTQVALEQSSDTSETKAIQPTQQQEQYWIAGGKRALAPYLSDTRVRLITMDMPGGCDLTPTKKFRGLRQEAPHFLVIHWGGSSLENLCSIFKSGHETSSNVGTGRGEDGSPTILQFLDLEAVAWHAGEWRNELSIGVDIAQDPERAVSYYAERGYEVQEMLNTTGRGSSHCITIDPTVKAATQAAIVSLCRLYDIPIQIPRGRDGQESTGSIYYGKLADDYIREGFRGVLAHFHTSNNKWDIAPWWEEVMLPILDK